MKVKIKSASGGLQEYAVKEFEDWNSLARYLKNEYGQWIINFNRDNTELFPESNPERAEEIDFEVTKYDNYVE